MQKEKTEWQTKETNELSQSSTQIQKLQKQIEEGAKAQKNLSEQLKTVKVQESRAQDLLRVKNKDIEAMQKKEK